MTKEKCEAQGGTWNDETGECTMPAAEEKAENFDFTVRLTKAFNEAAEVKIAEMEKKFDSMIESKLKALEIEAEQVLRKGLGVSKDAPLTTADIPKLVKMAREAALEKTENTRSPAALEKAGPAGNQPEDPFAAMLKPFTEEKKN